MIPPFKESLKIRKEEGLREKKLRSIQSEIKLDLDKIITPRKTLVKSKTRSVKRILNFLAVLRLLSSPFAEKFSTKPILLFFILIR